MGEIVSITQHKPLVKAEVVAQYIGCSKATVMSAARSGKIPSRSIQNGSRKLWRFCLDDVMHALEGGSGAA